MFARVGLPMIFVFLWSSAFVTGKVAVIYATPFALLLVRFFIVALLFGGMMLVARFWLARQRRETATPPAQIASADGWRTLWQPPLSVMLHGGYLGSVFLALSMGVPAGLTALVVSMQPLLSSFLAIFCSPKRCAIFNGPGSFSALLGSRSYWCRRSVTAQLARCHWPRLG